MEAASSALPGARAGLANWMSGVQLSLLGWLWYLLRAMGNLSISVLDSTTEGIFADNTEDWVDLAATLAPVFLCLSILWFLLRTIIGKSSLRDFVLQSFLSLLFVAAALLGASTDFGLSVHRQVTRVVNAAADFIPVDAIEEVPSPSGARPVPVRRDPLGCRAYIDELTFRSKGESFGTGVKGTARLLDVWGRWSYIPFWVASNYGNDSGYTGDRVHCRELELRSGRTGLERAELTACAAGRATNLTETSDHDAMCERGKALLGWSGEDPTGPFRDRISSYSGDDRLAQIFAWSLCVAPPTVPEPPVLYSELDEETGDIREIVGVQFAPGGWYLHPVLANMDTGELPEARLDRLAVYTMAEQFSGIQIPEEMRRRGEFPSESAYWDRFRNMLPEADLSGNTFSATNKPSSKVGDLIVLNKGLCNAWMTGVHTDRQQQRSGACAPWQQEFCGPPEVPAGKRTLSTVGSYGHRRQ